MMEDFGKQEYYQLIASRISQFLLAKGISQKKLLQLCIENGINISQATISKILAGSSMALYQIVQICGVLDLNLSEVLSMNKDVKISIATEKEDKKNSPFITDASCDSFHGYTGTFYVYFYQTTGSEEALISAKMEINPDPSTQKCRVEFEFHTGRMDRNDNRIKKTYIGDAVLSNKMQTMYCTLKSVEIGEICYFLFHYNYIAFEQLECRLATVITASSGIKRLPTMHRMLMTRRDLSEEELYFLSGQLRLNESEMLISETAFKQFLKDPLIPGSFFDYFGDSGQECPGFTSSVPKIPYYYFNESVISDSFLPVEDKAKIICLLRRYSAAPRYNKISDKADEIIYKYIKASGKNKENDKLPE